LAALIVMAANATAVTAALATANDDGRSWPGTVLITASAIAFNLAGLFTVLSTLMDGAVLARRVWRHLHRRLHRLA
jgi:hypothetical protein